MSGSSILISTLSTVDRSYTVLGIVTGVCPESSIIDVEDTISSLEVDASIQFGNNVDAIIGVRIQHTAYLEADSSIGYSILACGTAISYD